MLCLIIWNQFCENEIHHELMPLRLERSRITEYESTANEGLYVLTIRHIDMRSHTATTKRDSRFYEMRLDFDERNLHTLFAHIHILSECERVKETNRIAY